MLEAKTLKLFGKIYNAGHLLGISPYSWNHHSKSATCAKGRWPFVRLILQISVLLVFQTFTVYRAIETLLGSATKQQKIREAYITTVYIAINTTHYVALVNFGRLHNIVNGLLKMATEFNASHKDLEVRNERALRRIFWTISGCLVFAGSTNAVLPIVRPHAPTVVTSIAADPESLPIWIKIAAGLFHGYLNCFHLYPYVFYVSNMFIYVAAVQPMLNRLKVTENALTYKGEAQSDVTLQFQAFQVRYQQLAILQAHYDGYFRTQLIGEKFSGILAMTLNMLQAVLFWNVRSTILASVVAVVWIAYYRKLSTIVESSAEVLATRKYQTETKPQQKFFKSIKIQAVRVGPIFFADKKIIYKTILFVMSTLWNMIVLLR